MNFNDSKCRIEMMKKIKKIKILQIGILDLCIEAQKHEFYFTPDMFEHGTPSEFELKMISPETTTKEVRLNAR